MSFNKQIERENLKKEILSFQLDKAIKKYSGVDRFISASAMQKAIRRGNQYQAISAALSLLESDPKKCWHRLKVTALEDISLGHISIIENLMWAANHNKWREVHCGDEQVLKYFVSKLCECNNSRIANDLNYTANHHPKYHGIAREYEELNTRTLCDIYLDESRRITERAIAGWYICGVNNRTAHNMLARNGSWRDFISLHDPKIYPAEILSAMKMGFGGGEGHARVLALTWAHRNKAAKISVAPECKSNDLENEKWGLESLDIHTRIGKQSYQEVVKANNPISKFLKYYLPHTDHTRALGMSMFAIEGHLLHRREIYQDVAELLKEAVESYVADFGLIGDLQQDFFEVIKRNFDLVSCARLRHCGVPSIRRF